MRSARLSVSLADADTNAASDDLNLGPMAEKVNMFEVESIYKQ